MVFQLRSGWIIRLFSNPGWTHEVKPQVTMRKIKEERVSPKASVPWSPSIVDFCTTFVKQSVSWICSIINSAQKERKGSNSVSFDPWMDKQKIIWMHSRILFTLDKEILTHATTQMKLWRYYAKWNKPVMNKYVDMNLLAWGTLKHSNSRTERMVAVRSRRQPGRKNKELLFDGVSVWEDE